MVYIIVTDKKLIPITKSGNSVFVVLESRTPLDENKYIYLLLEKISSIEICSTSKEPLIELCVLGKSEKIYLQNDQKDLLFELINNFYDEDDAEESTSNSEEDD